MKKQIIYLIMLITAMIPMPVFAEYSNVWYEDGGAASGSLPWYHPLSLGTMIFWGIIILTCIAEVIDNKKK